MRRSLPLEGSHPAPNRTGLETGLKPNATGPLFPELTRIQKSKIHTVNDHLNPQPSRTSGRISLIKLGIVFVTVTFLGE
jgi:hypothetical protein